jgi:integrase
MPRRTRSPKLETRTSRLRLGVRKKPYAITIAQGVMLQYRRNRGAGTWGVRLTAGKDETHRLATADDHDAADGRDVLDYWQAQDAARAKAKEHEGSAKPITVAKALDDYEADLKTRRGDVGNVKRARGHLPVELLDRAVSSLNAGELKRWRDQLAEGMAAASANRTATCVKAALNLAADHDERIVRRPWKVALAAIRGAEQARNVVVDENTVRAIVAEAYEPNLRAAELLSGEARLKAEEEASHWAEAFGMLVEVLAVTGARVSQAARLEVQDLQGDRSDPRLMMPTSRKGKGVKRIDHFPVPIPASLALRLRAASGNRPPHAPLLEKPGGAPWSKSDHSRPFDRVVERLRNKAQKHTLGSKAVAAALDGITIYALRHSNIVRQLLAGIPIRVVASGHDTSISMIEKNYSRYIADHADELARKALLDLAAAPGR